MVCAETHKEARVAGAEAARSGVVGVELRKLLLDYVGELYILR